MRYRKLRIAWSVGCGVVCVLLTALWIWSYWRLAVAYCPWRSPTMIVASSWLGRMSVTISEQDPARTGRLPSGWGWEIRNVMVPKKPMPMWTYTRSKYGATVRFPHWVLILPVTILTVAPWIRWARQFSLRTLLIATTLVAVVLGLIVWVIH